MKVKIVCLIGLSMLVEDLKSQTFFSDDFNDFNISDWVVIDNDNDPQAISFVDEDEWFVFGDQVNGAIMSASQSFDHITNFNPDNFAISPPINLNAAQSVGLSLVFTSKAEVFAGNPFAGIADHYAVYLTTDTSLANLLTLTPVYETTISTADAENHLIDIAAYAGQTVHLVFRHFNCTGQGIFSIDNIKIKTAFPNDIAIQNVGLNRYALIGTDNVLSVNVINEGSTTITSLQMNWNDGVDHTQTINGLNIVAGAELSINHPLPVNYASPIERSLTVTISQPNGSIDPFPVNNSSTVLFNTVSQAEQKKVVVEEGTGTWCGYCPRGTVALEYMEITYPSNFIGIAVHNGDPMEDSAYNSGAGFLAFPNAKVDRIISGIDANIVEVEPAYNTRIGLTVPAGISAVGQRIGSLAIIEASATFHTPISAANYRLGVIITEDNISNTSSAYDQHNYYSSQSQDIPLFGAGHNWQMSPDPIPAEQMEYDHVGRALLGGYSGQIGSVPTTLSDGQVVSYSFSYTIPETSNYPNMYATVVLIDQSTGEIVNANQISIASLNVSDNQPPVIALEVYPNPAEDLLNVKFDVNGEPSNITITDMIGRVVVTKTLVDLNGTQLLTLPLDGFSSGNYLVSIASKSKSTTTHFVVR